MGTARTLVDDPVIILADEPTANIALKVGDKIMCLLPGIAKEQGRSVFIISHVQRIKKFAERVYCLEDGQLRKLPKWRTTRSMGCRSSARKPSGSIGTVVENPISASSVVVTNLTTIRMDSSVDKDKIKRELI